MVGDPTFIVLEAVDEVLPSPPIDLNTDAHNLAKATASLQQATKYGI
jgi:hypothetical protein